MSTFKADKWGQINISDTATAMPSTRKCWS